MVSKRPAQAKGNPKTEADGVPIARERGKRLRRARSIRISGFGLRISHGVMLARIAFRARRYVRKFAPCTS